jgi:uncharacterized protein (TIGR02444 family)
MGATKGLWDWALDAYARQTVAEACLHLQDAHGQNVPYLLWAAWMAEQGRTADLKIAAGVMRGWDRDVGAPLRGVRRALKAPRPPVDEIVKDAFREAVKALELQGERVLMESLEALAGPPTTSASLVEGLVAAAEASGDPPRRVALERLALALDTSPG